MKEVTNRLGLPEAIVRAVQNDPYSKGDSDFSATGLLKPPQIGRLETIYEGHPSLAPDAADRIYALIGTAIHTMLEENAPEDHVTEERIYRTIEVDGTDYVVSGAIDVQVGNIIRDYKCVGTGTVMYGDQPKTEWVQQLNIYQWLVGEPRHLEIGAIFRDWSAASLKRSKTGKYPEAPATIIPLPAWSMQECEDFVFKKVREHTAEEIRLCTDEERWDRGRGPIRCQSWCSVSEVCPQYGGGLF